MEQLNDTMTYYETLKKVVDYLNETSGQVSDLTDVVSYLQNEGLDLSVLDNFNTKLNDGTLGNLINNTILGSVNTQLVENAKKTPWVSIKNYESYKVSLGNGNYNWSPALQKAIDENMYIVIPNEEFNLETPVNPKAYRTIIGIHPTQSILSTKNDISLFYGDAQTENAYTVISNLKMLYKGVSASTKPAIKFDSNISGVYTSPRYSYFENLRIESFYDGFFAYDFWSVEFKRIRTSVIRSAFVFGQGVNDVLLTKCIMLGSQNAILGKPSMVVGNTGLQLTSIHVNGCDIENMTDYAFSLEAIEKFSITGLHMESCPKIASTNGVSNFSVKDSRFTGVDNIAFSFNNTYGARFNGIPKIQDCHFIASNTNTIGLVYYYGSVPSVRWDNNNVYNTTTGKTLVFTTTKDSKQGTVNTKTKTIQPTTVFDLQYSIDVGRYIYTLDLSDEYEKTCKVLSVDLTVVTGGTTTGTFDIRVLDDVSGTILFYKTITTGTTLNVGDVINVNANNMSAGTYNQLVKTNGDKFSIVRTNAIGVVPTFKMTLKVAVGSAF